MNMRGTHSRSMHDKEQQAVALVRTFLETYTRESLFISYFKAEWLPRIGKFFSHIITYFVLNSSMLPYHPNTLIY